MLFISFFMETMGIKLNASQCICKKTILQQKGYCNNNVNIDWHSRIKNDVHKTKKR